MYLKSQSTLKNPWPSLTLPQPLSLRYERAFHGLIRLGCLPSSFDRTRRSPLRPNPPPSPRLRTTRLNLCLLLLQPLALRWVLLQSRLGRLKTPLLSSRRSLLRILLSRPRGFHRFRRRVPHHLRPTETVTLIRDCQRSSFQRYGWTCIDMQVIPDRAIEINPDHPRGICSP